MSALARHLRRSVEGSAVRLALALPIGLGLGSLTAFGWRLVGGRTMGKAYVAFDLAIMVCLIVLFGLLARRGVDTESREPMGPPPTLWTSLLPVALALSLVVSVALFLTLTSQTPHGEWDAWAIWNNRARFFYRAGSRWTDAFAPELGWSHVEYPLLLSGTIARLFAWGGEGVAPPALVAATFAFAAVALIVATISSTAGRVAGVTGGLALLATPGWMPAAASQYADVPLATFVLAGLSCLSLVDRGPASTRQGLLALGGLSLALGAWTKNEGVVALAVALGVYWPSWARRTDPWAALRATGWMVLGALIPLAFRTVFQVSLTRTFAGDFGAVSAASASSNLLDVTRYVAIGTALFKNAPGSVVGLPLLVLAAAALLGTRPRQFAASLPLRFALVMLLCDFAIYVVTPLPLEWHLRTSADRVLLQTWPAFVLGALVAASQPLPPRPEQPSRR